MTEHRRLVVIEPTYRIVGEGDETFPPAAPPTPPTPRRRWRLPLVLFVLTCCSTLLVGFFMHASEAAGACLGVPDAAQSCEAYLTSAAFRTDLGLAALYAGALLFILTAHEMGHFLQAVRYRVPTSLPFFIPLPLPPFGTMGAILAMRPRATRHRSLFDVAVSGPLAGLVPTLLFTFLGLQRSEIVPIDPDGSLGSITFSVPPLYDWLGRLALDIPEGHTLILHPLAYAGWVGLFITALNLLPIGQLDGGHILYTLMPRHAHRVSIALIGAWIAVVVWRGYWQWTLMILLLLLIGLRHPPAARGSSQLGWGRRILGVAVLLLVPLSFSIEPIRIQEPTEEPVQQEAPPASETLSPTDAPPLVAFRS
ncbi:MAG: site-2 protease family protein [Acidobacteriota bacterium]